LGKGSTQSAKKKSANSFSNLPRHQASAKIVDLLNRASHGYNYLDFFRLFVESANLAIDELPHYAERAVGAHRAHQQGGPAPTAADVFRSSEPGLVKWREAGLHEITPEQYQTFADCFYILLDQSWDGGGLTYADTIGRCYMEMLNGVRWNPDEFYTPGPVALAMAQMSLHDADIENHFIREARRIFDNDADAQARMQAILQDDPTWRLPEKFERISALDPGMLDLLRTVNFMLSGGETGETTYERFLTEVLALVLPKMKPFTICDPCVGSGVLLLAAASCCPRWLIDLGYIQFFGQDLRHLPVRMSQLNMKLYGLGHRSITPATALSMFEILKMREPYRKVYERAKTPDFAGGGVSPEEAAAFARTVEAAGLHQLELGFGRPMGEPVDKKKVSHAVKQKRREADPGAGQTISLFEFFEKEDD
jgi:hypothetical protein